MTAARSFRRVVATVLTAVAVLVPSSARAAESATVTVSDRLILATNEAPAGLKEYVASQQSPPLAERLLLWGLLAFLIGGGALASFFMTRRSAELDGMASNAYLNWVRDRSMGHRRE